MRVTTLAPPDPSISVLACVLCTTRDGIGKCVKHFFKTCSIIASSKKIGLGSNYFSSDQFFSWFIIWSIDQSGGSCVSGHVTQLHVCQMRDPVATAVLSNSRVLLLPPCKPAMYLRIILWGRFCVLFGNVLTVTLEMIVNSQWPIFSSQHGCFPDYEVKCWKAM